MLQKTKEGTKRMESYSNNFWAFFQTQKLKHMAELQISVVTNDTHRSQVLFDFLLPLKDFNRVRKI